MKYQYVAIEGNIGAGKTTLATQLANELNSELLLEEFSDNSFLDKFYKNPEAYAFPLEVSFLVERFNQIQMRMSRKDVFHQGSFISDYIFDKSLIFARNTLNDDQYNLFVKMYRIFTVQVPSPDLIIYLHNSLDELQAHIRKRGRSYEQQIADEYLQQVEVNYINYFKSSENLRVILVDVSGADFVANSAYYEALKAILFENWPKGISRISLN